MASVSKSWVQSQSVSDGGYASFLHQLDARTLLCCDDNRIQTMDMVTGELFRSITISDIKDARIRSAVFDSHANELLTHTWSRQLPKDTIQFWNFGMNTCTRTLDCVSKSGLEHAPVEDMALKGRNLFYARHQSVVTWDLQRNQVINEFEQKEGIVRSLAFADNKLISGSGLVEGALSTGSIYCRDLATQTGTVVCKDMAVNTLVVDGSSLVAGTTQHGVRIWDIRSLQSSITLAVATPDIGAVLVHRDKIFVASYSRQEVQIWDQRNPYIAEQTLSTLHAPVTLTRFQFDVLVGLDKNGSEAKGPSILRYTEGTSARQKKECVLM
ncbi:MAG: hypothetical protein JSR97_03920 [Verrucomicrobia bacterium]|nr:hypothetical protein [Verrucomicrobiota bacterium]